LTGFPAGNQPGFSEYSLKPEREGIPMNTRYLTRTAILLAIVIAVQFLRIHQFVTGPLVNAVLLIAASMVGIGSGVLIGLLTPVVAFAVGILPQPLAPAIPGIMAGNAVLVITFGLLSRLWRPGKGGSYLGIAAGAVLKYLILAGVVRFLIRVPPPVAVSLQLPQSFTALAGGVIALIVIGVLRPASRLK
jgi:hypothetical protein